jgi:hypothetical protein
MNNDFILFVVGLTSSTATEYTIHALYQLSDDTWSNDVFWSSIDTPKTFSELLAEAGINYPTDSVIANDIEFTIGNNKVIINDSYNRMHYFEIDADGIANSGFLGIPAPLNKPCVLPLDTNGARGDIGNLNVNFEDDSGADYIEAPGLAQVTYTVITKFGEESNPSPISDALDLQWFKLNEDTGANEQWIDSIEIFNLNIPVVPKSVEDTLEKFRIYLRVTPYSQGITAKTLTFTEEFDISAKLTSAVDTGNDYIMTVSPSTGETVSYENDVAPVAKTSAELGGITMTGNVKTGHKFPFNFKYVHAITVNNKDSKFYVEPCFRIRLGDKDSTSTANDSINAPPIENFEILDFIDDGVTGSATDNHLKRSEFIRIYFEDQTTPCMLGYVNRIDNESPPNAISLQNNTTPSYIDLLIRVPYLRANDTTTIYLVWTPDNTTDEELYTGVSNDYNELKYYTDGSDRLTFAGNIGIEYGRIMPIGINDFRRHKLFPNTRVLDNQTVISFDFSDKFSNNKFFNKADGNSPVVQEGDIPQTSADAVINGSDDNISPTVLGYNNYPIFDFDNKERIPQNYWYANNFDSGIVLDNKFFKESSLDGKSGFVSFTWNTEGAELKNETFAYVGSAGQLNHYDPPAMKWDIMSIWGENHLEQDYAPAIEAGELSEGDNVISLNCRFVPRQSPGKIQFTLDNNRSRISGAAALLPLSVEASLFKGEMLQNNYNQSSPETITPSSGENLFILLSWNSSCDKVYLWVLNLNSGAVYSGEVDWDFKKLTDGSFYGVVLGSYIGSGQSAQNSAIKGSKYMDVTMKLGTYVDDYTVFKNYANRMGLFEKVIGYREDSATDLVGTSNNGISFNETKLVAGKHQQNMIKWTDVNHSSFPDLNYKTLKEPIKRIIAAPSFLQYQYQNTFLIFTRNTINRFVLEGSATGWAASSSSLIEEKKQYGLLADKSLMRIGDAVFWLSEVGVVKWDSQGLNLISKNVVNVKIDENSFAFYNSINNQYMLHDVDGITYVYHIDRNMWTKYTGLEVESTGILTGGNELANINLVLNNNQIDKFPSETYAEETGTIKTKDLFFENGLLKRVRLDYAGGSPNLTTNLTKIDSGGLEIEKSNTITGIQANKWRGIKNGYNRGRSVNIEITNAEEINSIIYDLNIESEVKT